MSARPFGGANCKTSLIKPDVSKHLRSIRTLGWSRSPKKGNGGGSGAGDRNDNGNDDDDDDDDDDGGDMGSSTPRRPSRPKGSMSIANARADKLVGHVDETCRALARPDLDPLNLESAIRIHLLVNVFLSRCAPVGEKASVKHPILAVELPRSWIRILGRLIIALEASLERTAANPPAEDIDEECVEALATILFCAGLLLDASRVADMPRAVVGQLETVNARLARSVGRILDGKPMADAAVRQKLPVLMSKHRLVPEREALGAIPGKQAF